MLISIDQFRGMIPRTGPRNIPTYNSTEAWDCKLWSGELRCLRSDRRVHKLPDTQDQYKTIYHYERPGQDKLWLAWKEDVDLAPGPIENDAYNRMYITGLDKPRVFDSTMVDDTTVTIDDTNSYAIKVTAPAAPTLAVDGTGTGDPVTRTYVVTYVREWSDGKQDESQASLPGKQSSGEEYLDVETGQTVKVSGLVPSPATDEGTIKYIRIYRSVTTSDGIASYRFVYEFETDPAEIASYPKVAWDGSEFTFTDDVKDEDLGEALPSMEWAPPLDTLQGIVSLRNGVFAAFSGNDVYFSEPYRPHAWPSKYKISFDYTVIGLGSYGNNIVICTDAYPHVANVQNPDAVIPQPVNELSPCMSKGSIISANGSVMYATPNGLISIDTSKPQLLSQLFFTRDEWARYNPSSFSAAYHRGKYYAFYEALDGSSGGILFDMTEQQVGVVNLSGFASGTFVEKETDDLYIVKNVENFGQYVLKVEGDESQCKPITWRSKSFTSTSGLANFSAARIDFGADEEHTVDISDQPLFGALNELTVNTIPVGGDVYSYLTARKLGDKSTKFMWYVDGQLVYQTEVKSGRPFRLPAGVRGTEYYFELNTTRSIRRVEIATSMAELS